VLTAKTAGLKALALTDHDTTEGIDELFLAGKRLNFKVIAGCELSLNYSGTTHMLGYHFEEKGVEALDLGFIKSFREERNREMFKKLVDMGFQLSWDRVCEIAGEGQLGKPHLALALVDHGYVAHKQEAFDKYLARGKPGYVEKRRLSAKEGIELLLKANYAPVLAHPISMGLKLHDYLKHLELLKEWGLVGVEAYHPDNGELLTALLSVIASRANLVATNGSDYHGANKSTALTWVLENSPLSVKVLDDLEEGLKATRKRLKLS
jgi:predicted metal-dependent phosphoesterase TrpH